MNKEKRRTHRKVERERRRRRLASKSGAGALAAAAAIAAGTQAYAMPVRFDNPAGPGHFDWIPEIIGFPSSSTLDITRPANDQPYEGVLQQGPGLLRQQDFNPSPGTVGALLGYGGDVNVEFGYQGVYRFVEGLPSGTLIPSGRPWYFRAYTDISYFGLPGLIPEGVETYVGVKFQQFGTYYGWIGVVRTGTFLDAFAWGYETDAGTPVAAGAPEPGTLALLAFGAAATRRRRRG